MKLTHFPKREELWAIQPVKLKRTKHNTLQPTLWVQSGSGKWNANHNDLGSKKLTIVSRVSRQTH